MSALSSSSSTGEYGFALNLDVWPSGSSDSLFNTESMMVGVMTIGTCRFLNAGCSSSGGGGGRSMEIDGRRCAAALPYIEPGNV